MRGRVCQILKGVGSQRLTHPDQLNLQDSEDTLEIGGCELKEDTVKYQDSEGTLKKSGYILA